MRQRSQIYVRIQEEDKDGKIRKDMVPMRYQWNYAERMVSRVATTAEWLKGSAGYYFSSQKRSDLEKILSTNFDMKDVVTPKNIFLKCAELTDDDEKFPTGEELNMAVFYEQDNNDGQAYIDVYVKDDDVKVKYAFTKDQGEHVMTADEYMSWDLGPEGDYDWVRDYMERDWTDEINYTMKNIKYLGSEATLMSDKRLKEFQKDNYDKQFGDRIADQYGKSTYDFYLNACAKAVFENAFEKGIMAHPEEVFTKALEVWREYQKNHDVGSLYTNLQKMKEEGKLDIEKEGQKESKRDPKEVLEEVKVTDLVIGTDSLVEDLVVKKSNEKEHYRVSIAVHGCYRVEFPDVNASGEDKAEYVLDQYDSADFGALSEAELQDPPTAEDLKGDMSSCIITISGRFVTHIEAKSPKEAYEEAFDQFENADFKELSDVEGDLVHVADDHGNYYESEGELEEDEMERE